MKNSSTIPSFGLSKKLDEYVVDPLSGLPKTTNLISFAEFGWVYSITGYVLPLKTATYLLYDEYKFLISFSVVGLIELFGSISETSNGLNSFALSI